MTLFDPATDSRAFRDALGAFATGVAVVTTQTETGPVGMTINSFASVSLTPPLVLWSIERTSNRYHAFEHTDRYAIHILRRDQAELALAFAQHPNAFAGLTMPTRDDALPVFDDCIARFECTLNARHRAGDHDILIGQVTTAHHTPDDPLVFQAGAFGGIG